MPDPITPVVNPDPIVEPVSPPSPSETVSKIEFEKVMSELHKWKQESKRALEEIEKRKVTEMTKNQEWEALYRSEQETRTKLEQETQNLKQSFVNEKKYGAVKEAAMRAGLRKEAIGDLDLLALENIVLETTNTGKMNILGADRFVDQLKTVKPHWFSSNQAPGVNSSGVRVTDAAGLITAKQVLEAEKKGKKSGDLSEYKDLFNKFRSQGRPSA